MIFNEPWQDYVSGQKFSNGRVFTLSEGSSASLDRIDVLTTMSAGKKVIHFGCADHVPLIEEKLASGTWLQERLAQVSQTCIGVDRNEAAIEHIKQRYGRMDCLPFDIEHNELPDQIRSTKWDFILMGEILEHVDNPVNFLRLVGDRFRGVAREIVVTVPNCLSWENILYSVRNKEFINTDHRYWFSPFTIAKVAFHAGLNLEQIKMCGATAGRTRLYRYMTHRTPVLRETIIASLRID